MINQTEQINILILARLIGSSLQENKNETEKKRDDANSYSRQSRDWFNNA